MRGVSALTHFPPGLLPLIASFLGHDWIVVAGGRRGLVVSSAVCYSLNTDSWSSTDNIASMSIGRHSAATVAIGGKMMVFGGIDDEHDLATCDAFEPATNTWTTLPPMSTPRACASAVAWQGRAFVFGGWSGLAGVSSVECFDPKLNRWSNVAPMGTARYNAAAVAVHGHGLLVMGGFSQDFGAAMESVELYDPVANRWTTSSWHLPKPLCDFAAQCIDGVLYIIGGMAEGCEYVSEC